MSTILFADDTQNITSNYERETLQRSSKRSSTNTMYLSSYVNLTMCVHTRTHIVTHMHVYAYTYKHVYVYIYKHTE